MSSFRERNDRSKPGAKPFSKGAKPAAKERGPQREPERAPGRVSERGGYDPAAERGPPREDQRGRGARHKRGEGGGEWLWGWHAVLAALANPNRAGFKRLLVAPGKAGEVEAAAARLNIPLERVEAPEFTRVLPSGSVHQGVALLADPVEPEDIEAFAATPGGVLLMLDQLTDPQNVGAIFRSAAAFGARGVILQDRHAPALTGALAKAAAGAIEAIPHARVVNLSRALDQLIEGGWRAVGLDGDAKETLEQVLNARPTVLVLGSEGEGLRRLVAEHCDALARIPMPGGFESLNVSNAAAVALYEASRQRS
ncbi:MAG: rRNA ((2251)-2-O)-methyltransferase RlmB [Caulobacteraceae bacterium]|nr:rRNA ((2251)-2-O)-methyltransferase RlmB [Caulobacteraceae bacterium]